MKLLKLIILLIFFSFQSINIAAMQGNPPRDISAVAPVYHRRTQPTPWESWAKEESRINALLEKRELAKTSIKSGKQAAGNSLINSLLTKTQEEIIDQLNSLPREMQEFLIEQIEKNKDLLDEENFEEKITIDKLTALESLILENLPIIQSKEVLESQKN